MRRTLVAFVLPLFAALALSACGVTAEEEGALDLGEQSQALTKCSAYLPCPDDGQVCASGVCQWWCNEDHTPPCFDPRAVCCPAGYCSAIGCQPL